MDPYGAEEILQKPKEVLEDTVMERTLALKDVRPAWPERPRLPRRNEVTRVLAPEWCQWTEAALCRLNGYSFHDRAYQSGSSSRVVSSDCR